MEGIFRSMAASDRPEHTDEFKRQMLHKLLANSSANMAPGWVHQSSLSYLTSESSQIISNLNIFVTQLTTICPKLD